MSQDKQPAFEISTKTLAAIIDEASSSKSVPADIILVISNWLTVEVQKSIRRARKKPLTKSDVEQFKRLHRKFSDLIESLQNRTLPPPRMPNSNGITAWDEWIDKYEQYGFIGGRRDNSDWLLVGALLALYETLSSKNASASQANGPTMRFLRQAFDNLAAQLPDDIRSNFAAPNTAALKRQLPRLNILALRQAKRNLAKAISQAGGYSNTAEMVE